MGIYFIFGQLAALDYYQETIRPARHDVHNRYLIMMCVIAEERQRLNKMLIGGEMRYRLLGEIKWQNY